jgi:hypothetical protein
MRCQDPPDGTRPKSTSFRVPALGRILGLALLSVGVLVFSVATPVAGASAKFSSTEVIDDSGHLVFAFEEGSMKRFATVDYRLDATAIAESCDPTGQQCIGQLFNSTDAATGLVPDDKGRVGTTLTLSDVNFPSPGPCTCGPRHVEYSDMTLTNLTSGHVYRLDSISRDFP